MLNEIHQHHGIPDDDSGEANHADHRSGREEDGIWIAARRNVDQHIKKPEARHDANHGQRNRQHDDQRQQSGTCLEHENHENPDQRRTEGQPKVAENVQCDLPFPFTGPNDRMADGHCPRIMPAWRKPCSLGCRSDCGGGSGIRPIFLLVQHHVHDRIRRRATCHFAENVDHAPEVLAVDRLELLFLLEMPDCPQLDQLALLADHVQLLKIVGS